MPPQAFWQGVEEFNQKEFYACHDTLEALWMDSKEPEKSFYKGVLQISVGCYHLGNHNWRGAAILLGEGIRNISEYEPVYEDIDVTRLLVDSSELLQAVQQIQPDQISQLAQKLEEGKLISDDRSINGWPKIFKIEPEN
ncbi:MAG: DUF309 domain-containing protein [Prochloraceae cyanobacterium]|nr:DUF309 domain-containing protein [Prochloraceae cyanobacterium]